MSNALIFGVFFAAYTVVVTGAPGSRRDLFGGFLPGVNDTSSPPFAAGGSGGGGAGGGGVRFKIPGLSFSAGGAGGHGTQSGSGWFGSSGGGGGVQLGLGPIRFGAGGGRGGGGVSVGAGNVDYQLGGGVAGFGIARVTKPPTSGGGSFAVAGAAAVGGASAAAAAAGGEQPVLVVSPESPGNIPLATDVPVPPTEAPVPPTEAPVPPIEAPISPEGTREEPIRESTPAPPLVVIPPDIQPVSIPPNVIIPILKPPTSSDAEPAIEITEDGIRITAGGGVTMVSAGEWKGDNVCVDRQTNVVDVVDVRTGPTGGTQHAAEYSCHGDDVSYICDISVNYKDKKKTDTIIYECCEGYQRNNGECTRIQEATAV